VPALVLSSHCALPLFFLRLFLHLSACAIFPAVFSCCSFLRTRVAPALPRGLGREDLLYGMPPLAFRTLLLHPLCVVSPGRFYALTPLCGAQAPLLSRHALLLSHEPLFRVAKQVPYARNGRAGRGHPAHHCHTHIRPAPARRQDGGATVAWRGAGGRWNDVARESQLFTLCGGFLCGAAW